MCFGLQRHKKEWSRLERLNNKGKPQEDLEEVPEWQRVWLRVDPGYPFVSTPESPYIYTVFCLTCDVYL